MKNKSILGGYIDQNKNLVLFLKRFFWIITGTLFSIIFLINLKYIDASVFSDPISFLLYAVVGGIVGAGGLHFLCAWVSTPKFVFYEKYLTFKAFWRVIGIAVIILFGLESFKYMVGLSLMNGYLFFIGMCLVNILGGLICLHRGGDVGRTVAQLYFFDFLKEFVLLLVFIAAPDQFTEKVAYFAGRSIVVGLDFAKAFAFITMLSMPYQSGWPSLIKGISFKRDNPSTPEYDRAVKRGVLITMLIGVWFTWHSVAYESLIHFIAPVLLLMMLLRHHRSSLETIAGSLPQDLVQLAGILDKCEDPEDRAHLLETYTASMEKLVQSYNKDHRQKLAEAQATKTNAET